MAGYDGLHPVFGERLRQLNDACGTWVNSGYRSSDEQQYLYDLYLRGEGNPANPPGTSNHEAEPWGGAFALAADIAGDLDTANARAADFGLHFPIAATEPWHVQPVEVPFTYFTGIPAELGVVEAGRPALRLKARGQAVIECQQRLNVHGFSCDVDGVFGDGTNTCVIGFQQAKALEVDGVVGTDTWDALLAEPPAPAPVPPPSPTAGRSNPGELRLTAQGAALIAEFEGICNQVYNDPAGNATIGIGHLIHEGPMDGCASEAKFAGGLTNEQCYKLFLDEDAPRYEAAVRDAVAVPLFQSEYDALVSFCFNVGGGALADSTLRQLLNQGDYAGAAEQFGRWVKAGGETLPGLVERRRREAELFRSQWSAVGAAVAAKAMRYRSRSAPPQAQPQPQPQRQVKRRIGGE